MKPEEMMEQLTAYALELSIKKWEDLAQDKDIEYEGSETCALCQVYSKACEDCPVCQKTGKDGCAGSPYEDYLDDDPAEKRKKVARRQLRFLKSLRKKKP